MLLIVNRVLITHNTTLHNYSTSLSLNLFPSSGKIGIKQYQHLLVLFRWGSEIITEVTYKSCINVNVVWCQYYIQSRKRPVAYVVVFASFATDDVEKFETQKSLKDYTHNLVFPYNCNLLKPHLKQIQIYLLTPLTVLGGIKEKWSLHCPSQPPCLLLAQLLTQNKPKSLLL